MTKNCSWYWKDFPYLNEEKVGKSYLFRQCSCQSQKPQAVIDTITNYYSYQNGSPHRGSHYLGNVICDWNYDYRKRVKIFLNSSDK